MALDSPHSIMFHAIVGTAYPTRISSRVSNLKESLRDVGNEETSAASREGFLPDDKLMMLFSYKSPAYIRRVYKYLVPAVTADFF